MRETINFKTLPMIWDGKSSARRLYEQFSFKNACRNGYFLTFIKAKNYPKPGWHGYSTLIKATLPLPILKKYPPTATLPAFTVTVVPKLLLGVVVPSVIDR